MNNGHATGSVSEGRWDYIVVGAGSAGCVLASRLSANGTSRVLLLEAGPRDSLLLKPFALYFFLDAYLRRFDWHYKSQPDPTRDMRVEDWRRGRVLGGTGSINGMNYVRGAPGDYDRWAAMGNIGWSANDLMPLFRDIETFTPRGAVSVNPSRGTHGPLHVREVRNCHPLTEAYLKAAVNAGFPLVSDYNSQGQDGVGYAQFNQKRGLRHSSVDAFLKPALKHDNFKLLMEAQVRRLRVEGAKVTGVQYEHAGTMHEAKAERIVLCAGAINTPQLLMLSGIGDGAALRQLGIEVISDRPAVGRNLMEHPLIRHTFGSKTPTYSPTGNLLRYTGFLAKMLWQGQGPIAALTEAQGFLRTSPEETVPDIQTHFTLAGAVYSEEGGDVVHLRRPSISIHMNKNHPKSRGQVRLGSADPRDAPLIEPNLLGDERDIVTLARAIKVMRRIISTPPIAGMITQEVEPGPDVQSEDALHEYVRRRTGIAYHPAGTCRMGSDDAAVVTPELNVRGMENLWIADASVMPDLITGNTNAVSMIIGEKAGTILARHP